MDVVVGVCDADWAKDRKERKSTSCGFVKVGGCTLYSFARTQTVQAQSSGEAEWYAKISTFIEMLLVFRLLAWIGIKARMEIYGDSAASRGISYRMGVGRIKHLEVKTLWFQEFAQGRRPGEEVADLVVPTATNCADIGTKPHTEQRLKGLIPLAGMKCQPSGGREPREIEQDLLDKDFRGTLQ
eukprot:11213583-Lingulodinium_polyedra.AAC.1